MKIQKTVAIKNGYMVNSTEKPYVKIECHKYDIQITFRDKPGANTYKFNRECMFRFPMDIINAYKLNGNFEAEWVSKDSYVINVPCVAKHVPKYSEAIHFKRSHEALDFSGMSYKTFPVANDGSFSLKGFTVGIVDVYVGEKTYAKLQPISGNEYTNSSLPNLEGLYDVVGRRMQFYAGYGYRFKSYPSTPGKVNLGASFTSKCTSGSVRIYDIDGVYYVTPNNIDEITKEEVNEEKEEMVEVNLCEEAEELIQSESGNDLNLGEIILMMKDMVGTYGALTKKVAAQEATISALKKELDEFKKQQLLERVSQEEVIVKKEIIYQHENVLLL